jgi:hypothetical protein
VIPPAATPTTRRGGQQRLHPPPRLVRNHRKIAAREVPRGQLASLAFPKELGDLLWLTTSFLRLGRGSRRRFDVPGHDGDHQPLIHEVRAVLLEDLEPGARRDVGLNVVSGCRIRRVPAPAKDSATSERVTGSALLARPRRKITRNRHTRRHRT